MDDQERRDATIRAHHGACAQMGLSKEHVEHVDRGAIASSVAYQIAALVYELRILNRTMHRIWEDS